MTALEKVLALAGSVPPARPDDDVAGELVRAARTSLTELRAYLADSGADDEDEDEDEDDSEGGGHSSHPTFKALKKRGMDDGKASSLCARADKRVKAAALAEAALLALAKLDAPDRDWVAATSYDRLGQLALSGGGGNSRSYADPGYLGAQRFPVDSEAATRLSLAYSRQDEHTAGYTAEQLAQVHARIGDAARSFGIALAADADSIAAGVLLGMSVLSTGGSGLPPISDRAHLTAAVSQYKQGRYAGCAPSEIRSHILRHAQRLGTEVDLSGGSGLEEAADLVALAAKPVGDGGIIMNHGPFNGTHAHGHFQSNVHHHPHQHFGDNHHDGGPAHRPGSQPGGRGGW